MKEFIEKNLINRFSYGTAFGMYFSSERDLYFRCSDKYHYFFESCKEYILDNTRSALDKGYVPKNTILVFSYNNKKVKENILSLTHQIENYLEIPLSQIEEVNFKGGTYYILTGDKLWTLNSPALSLYALLIRFSVFNEITSDFLENLKPRNSRHLVGDDEAIYNEKFEDFLKMLKNNKDYFVQDMKSNFNSECIHGYGIRTFLRFLKGGSSDFFINSFLKKPLD